MRNSNSAYHYSRLIAQSRQLVVLRWFVLGIGIVLFSVVNSVAPFTLFHINMLVYMFILLALVNIGADEIYQFFEKSSYSEAAFHKVTATVISQMVIDLGLITLNVHLTGGPESPNSAIFFLYLGAVATMLPKRWLAAISALAMISYSALMESYLRHLIRPVPLGKKISILRSIPPSRIRLSTFYILIFMAMAAILIYRLAQSLRDLSLQSITQQSFLARLQHLTIFSLPHDKLEDLYRILADQFQAVMQCDGVYLTRYIEENGQVISMAASGELHHPYRGLDARPKEGTLTEKVYLLNRPLVISDTAQSPIIPRQTLEHFPVKSILALPMWEYGHDNHLLGAAVVAYNQAHNFSQQEIDHATQTANLVSLMLSRGQLHHSIHQREILLHQLATYDSETSRSLNTNEIVPELSSSLMKLLSAQKAALFLLDEQTKQLSCRHAIHISDEYVAWVNAHYRNLPGAAVLLNGQQVVTITNVTEIPDNMLRNKLKEERVGSYTIIGLPSPHGPQGALALYWEQAHKLSDAETTAALLFASRAGIALYNAKLHARIERQSRTDTLTGLANRRAFNHRLEDEINRAKRYRHPFALLMMDLDGFKQVNDTFGHPMGDIVLKQVAACLKSALRETDFVARFGGDEFSAILTETDLPTSQQVSQKILAAIKNQRFDFPEKTHSIALSISLGIAIYPDHAQNSADILTQADQALYYVKHTCKGSIASAKKQL